MLEPKKKAKKASEPKHQSAYGLKHFRSCADPAEDVFVSLRRAALMTGIGREALRRMLREADCGPAARRGVHPVWTLLDIFEVVQSPYRARINPESLAPSSRLAHYTAERYKQALADRAASLVKADDFAAVSSRAHALLGQMLDTAEAGLAACGVPPEMAARLAKHFAATREQIAQTIGKV